MKIFIGTMVAFGLIGGTAAVVEHNQHDNDVLVEYIEFDEPLQIVGQVKNRTNP